MQNTGVIFKGDEQGIIIVLSDELDFNIVKSQLEQKFIQAGEFFNDDLLVRIKLGKRRINLKEKKELIKVFKDHASFSVIEFISNKDGLDDTKEKREIDTLLVKGTVRSGQSINYDGNIVIQGDVNPTAEVIAEGDIIVMGNFRGIAHAGAKGKVDSTISAFRLEPSQIRIANYISRAPDIPTRSPSSPEIAFVKDKHIMLDYLRK